MFYNYPLRLLGGGKEDRTPDPLLAKQVLSQLSYTPDFLISSKLNNAFNPCLTGTFRLFRLFAP